jgi:hypothetical protein
MRALFDALFAGGKAVLPSAFKSSAALLKAAAADAPSQLAALVALEWLVAVCEAERVKEVRAGWLAGWLAGCCCCCCCCRWGGRGVGGGRGHARPPLPPPPS